MKGIGFEYMYIHNRSGEMPLLLLCLLMCFYRDVPVDVAGLVEV